MNGRLWLAVAGGDAKQIAKAQEELEKGMAEAAAGNYDKAVDHYKKAWEEAMKALPYGLERGDGASAPNRTHLIEPHPAGGRVGSFDRLRLCRPAGGA